jgi:hypothetical protein
MYLQLYLNVTQYQISLARQGANLARLARTWHTNVSATSKQFNWQFLSEVWYSEAIGYHPCYGNILTATRPVEIKAISEKQSSARSFLV